MPRSPLLPLGLVLVLCLLIPSFALARSLHRDSDNDSLVVSRLETPYAVREKCTAGREAVQRSPAERYEDAVRASGGSSTIVPVAAKTSSASATASNPHTSPIANLKKPELPLFVLQVIATVAHSSGVVRTTTARVDAVVNPEHDEATVTSGVVSFVCKSIGLFLSLVVTAVVVFLASGPGL